jgi:Rad3-related DNA helicase
LEEDKCRLVILARAFYLSLGDRVVSQRVHSSKIGQAWYTCTMLLSALQACGRGVRSKEDYAETFVLDLQIKNALTKNPSFLPGWFLDAIEFELPKGITDDREKVF